MPMSTETETLSLPQRSIRDMLMTCGANGGRRLTDQQLADLLLEEINTLPDEQQDFILCGMIGSSLELKLEDISVEDEIQRSSPVA